MCLHTASHIAIPADPPWGGQAGRQWCSQHLGSQLKKSFVRGASVRHCEARPAMPAKCLRVALQVVQLLCGWGLWQWVTSLKLTVTLSQSMASAVLGIDTQTHAAIPYCMSLDVATCQCVIT